MNVHHHSIDVSAETDRKVRELAAARGQEASAVVSDAIALLEAIEATGPEIAEDRRRLDDYGRSGEGVPLNEAKAWVASWGNADELPRPVPRKIG